MISFNAATSLRSHQRMVERPGAGASPWPIAANWVTSCRVGLHFCSAATSVCEKSHCGELALLLHEQKRRHYVELGVFICNAIISAREKCPQMLRALLMLEEQWRS